MHNRYSTRDELGNYHYIYITAMTHSTVTHLLRDTDFLLFLSITLNDNLQILKDTIKNFDNVQRRLIEAQTHSQLRIDCGVSNALKHKL